MPDSPFCRQCWDKGKLGQTYRIAGQPNFRCSTCKTVYHEGLFEPWELLWRDDRKAWEAGMDKKTFGDDGKKVYADQKKRLDQMKDVK